MASRSHVVILGGGPAAVVLGRRLVDMGYDVTMVACPRPYHALEGFSPRTLQVVERYCCPVPGLELKSRWVHWGDRISAVNREALVDRYAFDHAILDEATAKGVNVVKGRVTNLSRGETGWQVTYRTPDGGRHWITGTFVVEARGRAAPLGGAGRVRGPSLVSLSRRCRSNRMLLREAGVASFPRGWAWFIPESTNTGLLQIFIDPGEELPPRTKLVPFLNHIVGDIPEVAGWLGDGSMIGPVRARHAGMVLAGSLCRQDYLRIGDAALAIDPLSGHGVYKAISGALAAAPVINTLMRRPGDGELAQTFYRERLNDEFLSSARTARDFYCEETRWRDRPFWAARRQWPDEVPAHPAIDRGVARIEKRPVVRGAFVESHEVLITPDQPRGVWHLAGVPAARLWRLLSDGSLGLKPVSDHVARAFGVTPASARAALDWFAERGLAGNG